MNTKLATISALVLGSVGAHAGLTIEAGDNLNVSGTVLSGSDTGYVQYGGGSAVNCYAGAFSLSVNDTTQNGQLTIQTFCTDVSVDWKNSDTYTAENFAGQTGVSPQWAGSAAIQDVAYLYATYFVGQTLNLDQDAGMQLAIWKLLYDTSADGTISSSVSSFGSGKLQAWGFGTTAMNDAENYISDVMAARSTDGSNFPTYAGLWLKPDDGDSQGLIYTSGTPTGNLTPVPEPSTIFAGAMLLLPLGVGISRTLRKHRAMPN